MNSYKKYKEAMQKETYEDREDVIYVFLEEALSLLRKCEEKYKKDKFSGTYKQSPSLEQVSNLLYEKRAHYEKFVLMGFTKLSQKILTETKKRPSSLLGFSLRTLYELFFKKLVYLLKNPDGHKNEKFLFVLADIIMLLRDDFPVWLAEKQEEIKKILSEKDFAELLKSVDKIEKKKYKEKDLANLRISQRAKSRLSNDSDEILNLLEFKIMNKDSIYFYLSAKIHGNPFMLETFLNQPERIKTQAYILLYETILNCLMILDNNYDFNKKLHTKISNKLNKEKKSENIKSKLAKNYRESKVLN